jgi:nitroimidazol reductase NimA-like FMN-containing flavoprotein (pyridoxamine 5'-phosphate oxidase superfamily)/GNAT superfamily N-acetyltransferase
MLLKTDKTTLRRRPQRGSHERSLVESILDEGMICHLGVRRDGAAIVLPMAYGRIGNRLYLHGARHNALLGALADASEACLTVTLLDGLVLSKSAFHHSMNYRAVVLFGRARAVTDQDEKLRALTAIVEHALPGRMSECRVPSGEEIDATTVIAFPIDEGSAKVRSGPPLESASDEALDWYSGVVPLALSATAPVDSVTAYPRSMEARLMQPRWEVTTDERGELGLSTDPARIDLDTVHAFLSESYWARGISRARLARALSGSLCVSVHHGERQVGFARVVTDGATFAWLADVFVTEDHRRRGIARWMVAHLRARPELVGLRRWLLATRDAHGVYAELGFVPLENPERFMGIVSPYSPERP